KFNGVPKRSFYLFLKECEWRFNTGTASDQLKSLRKLTRR
ncbi:MAG: IS1595 family transposase, partial [Planctomycetota bacterium]